MVPKDAADERLWQRYLEAHGCQVLAAQLSDGTPYSQVILPDGCVTERIGGVLEPVYRVTLPDGAIIIEYALRMREHKLVALGLPESAWRAWVAENTAG